jgi:hypothetical protein
MIRKVYIGRLSAGASAIPTGSSATLTGGEMSELSGCQILDVFPKVNTALTGSGTPTFQLKTANGVALTAAVAAASLPDKATLAAKMVTLDDDDVASGFQVAIGGTSTDFAAGQADFYALIHQPR